MINDYAMGHKIVLDPVSEPFYLCNIVDDLSFCSSRACIVLAEWYTGGCLAPAKPNHYEKTPIQIY